MTLHSSDLEQIIVYKEIGRQLLNILKAGN